MIAFVAGPMAPRTASAGHQQRAGIDVDEDRARPQHFGGIGCGDEGHCRNDHFVSGTQAKRQQCCDRPVSPAVRQSGVLDAEILAQLRFNLLSDGSAGQERRRQHGGDVRRILLRMKAVLVERHRGRFSSS